mgnify:CR=1 FL=1
MARAALVGLALAVSVAVMPFKATAQAPRPCEDQLRATRILAERYALSRQRAEVEAAHAMADLLTQLDVLRAHVRALEAEKAKGKEGQ